MADRPQHSASNDRPDRRRDQLTNESPIASLIGSAPITFAVTIAAVLVSIHTWTGGNIADFTLTRTADALQPWRYLTSAFPHADVVHLVFNIIWFVYFGVLIERVFGSAAMLGITAMFAAGSSAAEFSIAAGVVGLSGVVYGLFAVLLVLSRLDQRFQRTIGAIVTMILIGWFFFSIVMGLAGTIVIGNVAQASGALLGALLGLSIGSKATTAVVWRILLITACGIMIAGAVYARPYINFTPARATELAMDGDKAIEAGDYHRALEHYGRAIAMNEDYADHHYKLGMALSDMDRLEEAIESLGRAFALEPRNTQYFAAYNQTRAWLCAREAEAAFEFEEYERSSEIYERCLSYDGSIPELWYSLGSVLVHLEQYERAALAYRTGVDLDPTNEDMAYAARWTAAWAVAMRAYDALLAEDFQQSVMLYRQALRLDQGVYEWWLNLGDALSALGDLQGARTAYNRALRLDPDRGEAIEAIKWVESIIDAEVID